MAGNKQDMLQLGGVFIVDQAGTVRYVFESMRASEQPKTADVLRGMREGTLPKRYPEENTHGAA